MLVFFKKIRAEMKSHVAEVKSIKSEIEQLRSSFDSEVRKAIHNAYAGIVCASCGKNVFRGEGTWVHGNGGKAYCLNPCWKELHDSSKST